MKAMITGSSGFIGSRLAAHVADQGVSVEKVRHPALDKEYVPLLNDA